MRKASTERHIPDILDCLAQLSNNEVPTPPRLARATLDILPAEVWGKPDYVWLDPVCKSGIFLREIAVRLLEGLSDQIPNFDMRREHIYREMLWGTATTEMTGMISRRSLYYSRDASGAASVIRFGSADGNLPFIRSNHTRPKQKNRTADGSCSICGAPLELERGEGRENYAYSFIHGTYPTEEMRRMKFDVIVGNPPYQIGTEGSNRDRPLYQYFVDQAIALNPRYIAMITPSRWFAGGLGLAEFRNDRLNDRRMRMLVDYPRLYDAFPGVKIRGGVSYFLWEREYNGPCRVQTMWNGNPIGEPVERCLNEWDVLVRRNEAVGILRKVQGAGGASLASKVSSRLPFGFQTNVHGASTPTGLKNPVEFYGSRRQSWMARSDIKVNATAVPMHKVLMHRAYGEDGEPPYKVTAYPTLVGPQTACSGTYLVVGAFPTAGEAGNLDAYLRTRFVRFLVQLRMNTQDIKSDTFTFVPDLPMDRRWTDADLYERFGLTEEEIAFIESQVKEMPAHDPVEPLA
ncbi:Eco57I restriction-modification methylase domain-containing protein [Micromonospora hortensis]|uniref:Eco57I restriction-modification methylase domain-containing protein n=1 Tax=Micromonospora hortensis TaxID=2911209 RepID=UPI001EE99CFD|nr:Eco57I restriction-modification methylase domain-containing protein [Micromonospora hortensis]MCG5453808.1 Eco57I restriction-modification methylase domain-containing protein [Micromonospora hortensis]